MKEQGVVVFAKADTSGVDEALKAVDRLNEKLKEAQALVRALASMEISVTVNVE